MGRYTNALVCQNGHLIAESIEHAPQSQKTFCLSCGLPTLNCCPGCGAPIQGAYIQDDGRFDLQPYQRPGYCHACGHPFPWTMRALEAAAGIVDDEEQLTNGDKRRLKESLPDLLADNPGTQLAILRVRKAISKVGKFSADALRQFVLDHGSDKAVELLKNS